MFVSITDASGQPSYVPIDHVVYTVADKKVPVAFALYGIQMQNVYLINALTTLERRSNVVISTTLQ